MEDLYTVSEEAGLFLRGRFDQSPAVLQPYLRKLKKALGADPIYNEEIDWVAADKVITNYRIVSGNNEDMAKLLITYVYEANQFTLEYGDIDEEYYESVEESFQKAVDHLLLMEQQGEPIASHVEELEEIVDSTSDIGWGYHDALGDMFYKAFGGARASVSLAFGGWENKLIADVVAVLTDSVDPAGYLKDMRRRDPELGVLFKGGGQFAPPPPCTAL